MRRRAKLRGTKTKSATQNRVKGKRACSVNRPLVIHQAVRLKRTAIHHSQNWIQGCGVSMWVIVPNGEQLNMPRPPTIQHEGDQSHVEIITLSNHALVRTDAVPPTLLWEHGWKNTAGLYVSFNTFGGLEVLISPAKWHYKFDMVIWYAESDFQATVTRTVWHPGV